MALVNPCKSCKVPHLLRRVSERVESTLPTLQEGSEENIKVIQDERLPEPARERLLGVLANTAALVVNVHVIAERANAQTCNPGEDSCDRAFFVMEAFNAAMDNAVEAIGRLRDQQPPEPTQPPGSD